MQLGLEEMLGDLYSLDRWELRRLAAEALLISDGPDSPHNINEQDPGNAVRVKLADVQCHVAFTIEILDQGECGGA